MNVGIFEPPNFSVVRDSVARSRLERGHSCAADDMQSSVVPMRRAVTNRVGRARRTVAILCLERNRPRRALKAAAGPLGCPRTGLGVRVPRLEP